MDVLKVIVIFKESVDWSECVTLLREKRVPGRPRRRKASRRLPNRPRKGSAKERKSTPAFSERILKIVALL
ncbi:hypothetical protein EBO34_18085 [Alteribacter keqinensis]|uniref:Uncharacterized protein n=1 Tax=Alteribacter keqinensis TaxID=2483800 RepID=A0A3M7TNY1_9BACI|nr:hypothetical protein EBO34_18085 [Alteribacter keqinensis]